MKRTMAKYGWSCVLLITGIGSCVPRGGGDPPTTSLSVVATSESIDPAAGTALSLSATATDGTPPYLFRWDVNAGPAEVVFADATAAATATDPILTAGRYVFRVVVTDAAGQTAMDFVEVNVTEVLTLSVSASEPEVSEGESVTLTADATAINEPVLFRWELASGPAQLDLAEASEETLTTDPLTVAGEYIFRVTATDAVGVQAFAEVTVFVLPAVTTSAPALVVVGEPAALSATLETEAADVTFLWEVVTGTGTFDDATSPTPMITTEAAETLDVRLTVTLPSRAAEPVATTRDLQIVSVTDLSPRVRIETNLGDMVLELDGALAPRHTANMLLYVDEMFYDGVLFHRAACASAPAEADCPRFVLQGGGFKRVDGVLQAHEPTRDPVESEAGNGLSSAVLNSVALALAGGDPRTGTTEFFFNLADNGFLDDRGFTVFGMLVEGTEVIDAIFAIERTPSPILLGEVSLPIDDVIMERVTRVQP